MFLIKKKKNVFLIALLRGVEPPKKMLSIAPQGLHVSVGAANPVYISYFELGTPGQKIV